jgi:hypothetical protein
MAGVKISQLQDGGTLQATDAFPVARGSLTRKILGAQLLDPLQSLDTRLNALSANTIFVANSPTIDLTYNSVTRTLSADVSTTVRNASAINVVDSSTIDLDWNASTRTLSARVIPLALPTTKTFNMYSVIGSVTWGAPYESTNPAYPGGRQAIYNRTLLKPLSADSFTLAYDSAVYISDLAYWNYDGGSGLIFIWQTYDYSVDGGATWIQDLSANTGTVRILQGTSYYGAPVDNGGGIGTGSICLTAGAGTTLKFRPKYRFQKPAGSPTFLTNMTGTGSHIITIEPLNS